MNTGAVLRRFAEWAWYAEDSGAASFRAALAPLASVFGAAVNWRNRRFDHHAARGTLSDAPLPALSVGNLTVGGTGKTPVASWFAGQLLALGASPAIVLRGYGDDEWRVHALLAPDVPVIVNPDRIAGMLEARARGADCVVLDDAFQHRRARRISDVVLVSADRFAGAVRCLPAGPYREPLSSLRRASAVVITVKAADESAILRTLHAVQTAAPQTPVAIVRLAADRVCPTAAGLDDSVANWMPGRRLLLVTAIADPEAFARQIRAAGARVVAHHRFPDHHAFSAKEAEALSREGCSADGVLCTLKDAVKLGPLWPRAGSSLWYVSQTLVVDRGADILMHECERVLMSRPTRGPTAG